MKGDFQTLWRRFCIESSILGLKYFYLYPDLFSRCFWAISMMSVVYLAYDLTFLLHFRFLEMPTRISIENQYEPLQNLTFPAITICSPNQLTISAMMHLNRTLVDGNRNLDFHSILPQLMGLYKVTRVSKDDLERFQDLILINRYSVSYRFMSEAIDILELMPQSCDDFLKLCYLKHQRYPNCKGLFNPILTAHGMCCIFNSVYAYNHKRNEKKRDFVPYKTSDNGVFGGLIVVTDYNVDDALNGSLLRSGAMQVMITESTEFPVEDESTLVTPNVETFHVFNPTHTYCSTEVSALPTWSRKCFFEDEYQLPYFHHYRNSDCEALCHARKYERACSCIMPYLPYVRTQKSCNISSIACIASVRYNQKQIYAAESCDCIRDCESFSYANDLVVGNLDGLEHIMEDPYSDLVLSKSSSIMHFYFQSSVYVKQKQETVISLISLFSNLGGVFGLCLGCSAMSVFEIIFYIYSAITYKINKQSQTTKKKNNKVSMYIINL